MIPALSRRLGAAILVLALGLPVPALALSLPGPLVDPAWLAEHLGEDGLVVIDMRPEEALEDGPPRHIPGALPLAFSALRMEREESGQRVSRLSLTGPAFEQLMQRHGVDAEDAIVVTWSGSGGDAVTDAAYLYWQLKYFGHDRVAMLDGGNAAWQASGHDMTGDAAAQPETGNFTAGPGRAALLATTEEVRRERAHSVLVDSRPLAFHIGLETRDYVHEAGHIPGSDLFPFPFYTEGGEVPRFRSPEQLRAVAENLGVELGRPMIVYCNSGHTSASGWFVLHELLGQDVALYDGSLHAWTILNGDMTTQLQP